MMTELQLKDLLDSRFELYHTRSFIESDPLQIPHRYSKKEDIEISGFLTSTLAWGRRKSIINSAERLMKLLDDSPADFIMHSSQSEWSRFKNFVHRTFQPADLNYFLDALRRIYLTEGGLEKVFMDGFEQDEIFGAIVNFRRVFLQWKPEQRTYKHVSDPEKGSASKRLNLFLLWMCRQDNLDIHFGLWKKIPPSKLIIPLDVHVGRVARDLGLIERRMNDWKAAEELTSVLRMFDPNDPVKYDFSLFGIGMYESD
ncbi:MAG: TIGR02757 family protein [Bacteroidales bacterium]|nr:TIGR02757 family protein [Bacteroidales bacterium]